LAIDSAVGLSAATLTALCWLPQLSRTLRTRKADDFSWGYLIAYICGVSAWLTYGVLRQDGPIIVANAVTAASAAAVLSIKTSQRRSCTRAVSHGGRA
jgi:MtN3 and saliva related transmembrane protein